MSDSFDTRVSVSLHPANLTKMDGYDDDTRSFLAPTETAFSEAYVGIARVHDARAAAGRNPTWNDEQRLVEVQNLADKVFAGIARSFDSASAALTRSVTSLEQELSTPIAAKAAAGVAAEIRAFIKNMDVTERFAFLRQAVDDGDEQTISSVLGAPAYLSGIDKEMQGLFTRQWHERANPQTAKRLKAMKGALDMIGQRSGLVFKEMEKAVGAPQVKVQAIKKAKADAERAFVLPQR